MIIHPASAKSFVLAVTKATVGTMAANMAAGTLNQVFDKLVSMGINLHADDNHPTVKALVAKGVLTPKE